MRYLLTLIVPSIYARSRTGVISQLFKATFERKSKE